ncbi:transcriptional regulator [Falsiroseomonas bella]|uniref:Transcriptional regulator n=1 Tax=Falsiroseomonas bella TaxID=2184016 RepID=A0A317FID7_9PROT|nr:helix-turn-helix transcriptional regulator [Falsiroseomonas bella]PWS38864.1 transcriptional regulator [Falsiroseomonas bella]
MATMTREVGGLIREWRRRRRLSQLDLASEAEISQRHLSFLESGRSRPSRDMLLHLAEQLEVPLRERNLLLVAAGFAPHYPQRDYQDPAMAAARAMVGRVLAAHEPFPALAVDRHWTMLDANRAVAPLLAGVAPWLLRPPVNVLRLALHPEGVAPRVVNAGEWRAHILERLRRQAEQTADTVLVALLAELRALPGAAPPRLDHAASAVAVPLRLRSDAGELSFISTTTVFGTPVDVTLSELAIETFLPADAATSEVLRRAATPAA